MQTESVAPQATAATRKINGYLLAAFIVGAHALPSFFAYETLTSGQEYSSFSLAHLVALPFLALASVILAFFAIRKDSFLLAILAVVAPLVPMIASALVAVVGVVIGIPYLIFEFQKAGL